MSAKKIIFTRVTADAEMPAQPDGYYVVISFSKFLKDNLFMGLMVNPFPWSNVVYKFESGLCDKIIYSSNFPDLIQMCDERFGSKNIKMTFLVGLSDQKVKELIDEMSKRGIDLAEHVEESV